MALNSVFKPENKVILFYQILWSLKECLWHLSPARFWHRAPPLPGSWLWRQRCDTWAVVPVLPRCPRWGQVCIQVFIWSMLAIILRLVSMAPLDTLWYPRILVDDDIIRSTYQGLEGKLLTSIEGIFKTNCIGYVVFGHQFLMCCTTRLMTAPLTAPSISPKEVVITIEILVWPKICSRLWANFQGWRWLWHRYRWTDTTFLWVCTKDWYWQRIKPALSAPMMAMGYCRQLGIISAILSPATGPLIEGRLQRHQTFFVSRGKWCLYPCFSKAILLPWFSRFSLKTGPDSDTNCHQYYRYSCRVAAQPNPCFTHGSTIVYF